ncbi:hypothetical protein KFE25_006689 [Diacronema lutheri]|uniref:Arb2 domain-containing protein n=2 Tax=Diacronema lutheri TaxID=2081491 RepID=A0A8J5XSF3_DIALT|nr:hypothetical protein KFE25_006689 [Diacronema lutheri]
MAWLTEPWRTDGARRLLEYGFEYRTCDDGLVRLHHLRTGTRLNAHNWQLFAGGDYGHLADAAQDHFHALCHLPRAEGGFDMRWWSLAPPSGAPPDAPTGKVLATADLERNSTGLLVVVPGTGSVRAGMWARGLLIHASLEQASAHGLISHALARGWSVVCFDPNRLDAGDARRTPLAGSRTREAHCASAWRQCVTDASPAARIAVVAHSAGGSWLLRCLQADATPDTHVERLRALAFSDSIHTMAAKRLDARRFALLAARGRQWRAGPGALDEPMADDRAPPGQPELGCGCPCVRAGTDDHSLTVFSSQASVLAFVDACMDDEDGGAGAADDAGSDAHWLDAPEDGGATGWTGRASCALQ